MESFRPKKIHKNNHKANGRTKANAPCRKHPKHIQSPGVCSICLNQRLSKLTSTPSSSRPKRALDYSSSSSSSYISSLSSSDGSSYSSPVFNYRGMRSGKSTRLFGNIGREETLKKSRSMAFFMRRRREEDGNGKEIEIRRGFWSKFFPRKSKGLMHSKTTRERVVIAAVQ